MTTPRISIVRRALLPALLALACTCTTASAQGTAVTDVSATVRLVAQDLPVTVAYNYQSGTVPVTYTANGTYSQPAATGLGSLVSIRVYGRAHALGIIDNETTPGTGHTVHITTGSRIEGSSTVGFIIIVDDVVI